MEKLTIDEERLNSILKRLFVVPPDLEDILPPILLQKSVSIFRLLTNSYFILAFFDEEGKKRTMKYMEEKNHPFPTLFAPEIVPTSIAFSFENSKNILLKGNTVINMFSLSLGKNTTIILQDHKISVKTEVFGNFEYTIDLAYIISFGDEIDISNFYNYLNDLITYSFTKWRSTDV